VNVQMFSRLPYRNDMWICKAIGLMFSMMLWLLLPQEMSAQDKGITFVHKERTLQPGELVLVKAVSSRPLSRLVIEAFDKQFPAFSEKDGLRWVGLMGIDLDTKPGCYEVKLQGIDINGKSELSQGTLCVVAKRFPIRELKVEEKYVTPPESVQGRIKEEREGVDAIFATVTPRRFWNGSFLRPVPGEVISAFGKRSIYNKKPRSPHAGVDFRGAVGTPVHAPNAGRVVLAAELYYSGNTVILDHGLGLYSYFGHLSGFNVKQGDMVKSGEIIGKVGATGLVTGPHLHWTVRLAESRIDPLSLIDILQSPGKAKSSPGAK
jgi:murein DD-endopeptidase MepM/ murein hydrolase activator NlpD